MRLEPLRRPAALAAVALPLAGEARPYAPGVAERLVDELLKVRIHTLRDESVEIPGELVEPVQLQVVCRTLWSSLPPDAHEIGEAELGRIGGVADVCRTTTARPCGRPPPQGSIPSPICAREDWKRPSSRPSARAARSSAVGRIAGMPRAAIAELEARHLVRAEWRAGARWFGSRTTA